MSHLITKINRFGAWALCLLVCLGLVSPFASGTTAAKVAPHSGQPSAPAPNGVGSFPRLGVEGLSFSDNNDLVALSQSGVQFARVQAQWGYVQPDEAAPYTWDYYDSLFSRMATQNISPLVTLIGCPLWACLRDNGPIYDNKYDAFGAFLVAFASRYGHAPYNVHYYEFWNEPDGAGGPNNQWGWGMHPDKYVHMLQTAQASIKPIDPNSVLMNGGMAYDFWFNQGGPFNPDFLPNILDLGAAQYLDALAFHYYRNNAHGWTNIALKTDAIRAVMSAHDANLPLIVSETGLTSSSYFSSSPAIQARYLVQMTAQGASSGLLAQVWYADRDYVVPGPTPDVFADCGLLNADNSPKLSYMAMQVLAHEVGSGAYLRQLGPDEGVGGTLEGYRFRTDDPSRQASVVWNNSSGIATLIIPASQATSLIGAVSLYGDSLQVRPGGDGTLLVDVGSDPVYLEWNVPRFDDVPFNSWMYAYVEYLASRSIVSGYSDWTFRPSSNATRGQFAKMTVLGMGWQPLSPATPTFADVPPNSPFYSYIEAAYSHGIIVGYACGDAGEPCPGVYFRPGNNVSRGQIAKMLVLGKGWTLSNPAVATFPDVPLGSPFFSYVETVVAHGVASGYSNGTFGPGNNATRAQLSKMLAITMQQP